MTMNLKHWGLIIAASVFLSACEQPKPSDVDNFDSEQFQANLYADQGVVAAMAKPSALAEKDDELKLAEQIANKQKQKSVASAAWLPTKADHYTVLFDLNSNSLNDAYTGELVSFAQYLNKNPSQKIHVDGYTCELGSAEYNVALGQRRAYAVSKFLESKGVSSQQIVLVSYGKERPIDPSHNEIAWTKNRRVEVFF